MNSNWKTNDWSTVQRFHNPPRTMLLVEKTGQSFRYQNNNQVEEFNFVCFDSRTCFDSLGILLTCRFNRLICLEPFLRMCFFFSSLIKTLPSTRDLTLTSTNCYSIQPKLMCGVGHCYWLLISSFFILIMWLVLPW